MSTDHTPLEHSQLSALADGELNQHESDLLLRRLSRDHRLSSQWQRYHLIRACLQSEASLAIQPSGSLQQRVSQAISDEPVMVDSLTARVARRWLQPAAGAAIAASVAVVAVVGLNADWLERNSTQGAAEAAAFTSQSTPMDRLFTQPPAPVSWSQPSELQRARFNQLLHQHNQVAAGSVFVPIIPVLITETGEPTTATESSSSGTASDRSRPNE
jgi:sigma-E factor negative regulatory protein RseA